MKAYGYERDEQYDRKEQLLSLREVGITGDPSELRALAQFISRSADLIEKHGEDFGHEHLQGNCPHWNADNTDFIVAKEED